jgi:hypothetical protein
VTPSPGRRDGAGRMACAGRTLSLGGAVFFGLTVI